MRMDLLMNTTPPTTSSPDYNSTHWYEQCFVGYVFLDVVDMLVSLAGLPCNIRVLLVLLRGELHPSTSDLFTGSLAVLDSTFCLSNILFVINRQLVQNYVLDVILLFLFAQYEVGGPVFVCSICLDRYAAVIHPITFTRYHHPRYRLGLISVMWCLLLSYAVFRTVASFDFNDSVFTTLFIVAFVIITYCNLALLLALKRSGPGDNQSGQSSVKRRAFHMVLGILVVVIFCFLPTAVLLPFQQLFPHATFICVIFPLYYSFMALRVFLQPLLFLFRCRKLPCMRAGGGGAEEGGGGCCPCC